MADKETTSFMRSLCMGRVEEELVLPFPQMAQDDKQTLQEIADSLKSLLGNKQEDFRKWDVAGELPKEFIEELKEFGMFGLVIPQEFGGLGLGNKAYSRTLQEIARYD